MPLKHGRSVTPCTPHPFFVCHEIFVTLKCPLLSPFSDKSLKPFRFSMSWLFNPRGLDYLSTWSRGVIIPTRQRQVNARQRNPLAVSSNPGQLAVCRIKWGCWIRGHALNFNKKTQHKHALYKRAMSL